MVCLPIPVPHPLFVHYSDKVCYRFALLHELPLTNTLSLRVNLDMGKTVYGRQIEHDPEIPDTIVRTSTLPEELGRIEYLLSDKTGTLTQNGTTATLRGFSGCS